MLLLCSSALGLYPVCASNRRHHQRTEEAGPTTASLSCRSRPLLLYCTMIGSNLVFTHGFAFKPMVSSFAFDWCPSVRLIGNVFCFQPQKFTPLKLYGVNLNKLSLILCFLEVVFFNLQPSGGEYQRGTQSSSANCFMEKYFAWSILCP